MVQDFFIQRKNSILSKKDKSFKKEWDKEIISLCDKLNNSKDYYTTSSCSGRVVLILSQQKKEGGLFCKVYHDLISLESLKKDLDLFLKKFKNKEIIFKVEPPILHVACRNLESAKLLYEKAKLAGWKRIGIVSWDKRVVLEINSTEKLELPIISQGKILVDEFFLKKIVKISNFKLKSSWMKIKKLEKLIN